MIGNNDVYYRTQSMILLSNILVSWARIWRVFDFCSDHEKWSIFRELRV